MSDPLPGAPERSPRAGRVLWLFLAFLVLYVGVTRGHFIGTDEIAVYQATRSLWEEGNLSTGHINNTFRGRDGRFYGQYSAGQSVAALPLYALGTWLGRALDAAGLPDWKRTFAGPSIGTEPSRWGGDIEMFFVNLYNAIVTALLCAVFFAFSVRLGAAPRWSLASSTLLGLTSYVAPFSVGFLQHSSEALFLLSAFYFLFLDSREPSWRSRAWSGVMVALMLLFRFPSVVALPALAGYLLWTTLRRRPPDTAVARQFRDMLRQALPLIAGGAAGFLGHLAVNYIKFETIWGFYNNEGFHTPLGTGLYAFLLSPGDSIFLYTPLLLLIPWALWHFTRRYPAEAALILSLTASYLVFYGKYTAWHGLWSALGPRYLVPIMALLLLPLATWMEHRGRAAWLVVGPLAAAGFWAQLVHVAVNFAYVYHRERYPDFQPPYGFLFVPGLAPLLAHTRALLSGDQRVDMWLVNIDRDFGFPRVLVIALPLLSLLAFCLVRLARSLRMHAASGAQPEPLARRRVFAGLAVLCIGMGVALALDRTHRASQADGLVTKAIGESQSEGEAMRRGLDLLYTRNDPVGAAVRFRWILEHNPTHYGATFQLATALDRAGHPGEARRLWERVLIMAELYHDAETASTARQRLARPQ